MHAIAWPDMPRVRSGCAELGTRLLSQPFGMSRRHGGLCHRPLLGARAGCAEEQRTADAIGVKPYVKRNKTDAAAAKGDRRGRHRADHEACGSAVCKDSGNALMLHGVHAMLVRQRTVLAPGLRAHLAEFGIISPQGIHRVDKLTATVHSAAVLAIPREALMVLVGQLENIWRRR